MLDARLAVTLEASVERFLHAADQNLGHLETQALHDVQALLRQTIQRAAQAKADATPPRCPVCGQPLSRCSAGHARTFLTRFGDLTIQRTRGYGRSAGNPYEEGTCAEAHAAHRWLLAKGFKPEELDKIKAPHLHVEREP